MPTKKMPFIPPGGFAGFAQQTVAVQALVAGSSTPRRRRKKTTVRKKRRATTRKRKTPVRRRRRTTSRKRKPARLVKGSAAAKRHMAKLRRMRRKR